VLLVVTPSRSVATWARQPIDLGHPGFRLVPIVITFDDVPKVRDRVAASRLPELAVLSAMAHREIKIAEAAIEAILPLKEDQARLYLDVILDALPAAKRRRLEARMLRYEYKSDFARKYYGEGLEKGLQDGVEQGIKRGIKRGRREGRQEGHQAGLRGAVITLAQARLKPLSDELVSAINAVSDARILTELVSALGKARSVRAARAALESALAGPQRESRRRR
jgi:predicted transposase YdaD